RLGPVTMATHARSLAERLAAADDELLAAIFARRGVAPDAGWNDFFDAAEALLAPASVERVLRTLNRDEASALSGREAPPEALRSLEELLLVQPEGTAYPVVTEAVAALAAPAHMDAAQADPSDAAQSA